VTWKHKEALLGQRGGGGGGGSILTRPYFLGWYSWIRETVSPEVYKHTRIPYTNHYTEPCTEILEEKPIHFAPISFQIYFRFEAKETPFRFTFDSLAKKQTDLLIFSLHVASQILGTVGKRHLPFVC
jgi:hypothetical protein